MFVIRNTEFYSVILFFIQSRLAEDSVFFATAWPWINLYKTDYSHISGRKRPAVSSVYLIFVALLECVCGEK